MFQVVLACALFATLWAIALVKPERVLPLAIFLAPWHGLDFDLGVRITAFRLVAGALVAAGVVRIALGKQRWVRVPGMFWVFVVYGIALSLIQLPRGMEGEIAGGALRGSTPRALLQVLLFILELGLVPLVAQMIRDPDSVRHAGRIYIASCVILSALGWLQVGTWLSTGWNPFPIGLVHSLVSGQATESSAVLREGTFDLHGITIVRMNALGGEPKGLGTGLAVGLVLIQTALGTGALVPGRRVVATWLFLFASMLATFSTSGFVLWMLGSLMSVMVGVRTRSGVLRGAVMLVCLPLLAAIVMLTAVGWLGAGKGVDWWELAMERTVGRDYIEDFDEAVGGFLIDHPTTAIWGVGLGNIHLYAEDYIPGYAIAYAGGTAFTAKSGALRLVSELGIVGLCLFLVWLVLQIRSASRFVRHVARTGSWPAADWATLACLVQLSIVTCLIYLARGGYVAPQTFLMFGLLSAVRMPRSVRMMVRTPLGVAPTGTGGPVARSFGMAK
jgi:hypothetical protein